MKFALFCALALLAGCTTREPIKTAMPDGRSGYSVDCSGTGIPWGTCFNQAAELCGGGYSIVSQTQTGFQGVRKELVFACKN